VDVRNQRKRPKRKRSKLNLKVRGLGFDCPACPQVIFFVEKVEYQSKKE